jgi:predicted TIM-barrel fold metal-dependent hydrolase
MERLIVVSGDSHAVTPPELWPQYLDAEYHHLLAEMHEDNEAHVNLRALFAKLSPEVLEVFDTDGVYQAGGFLGVWDVDRRLAQMDREGITAEFVYGGDPRAIMPLSPQYHYYSQDVVAAGVRSWHRWAADAFGSASDRIMMVGNAASAVDMDAMLRELEWIAEHRFASTYLPGYFARHDLPPLYDRYWDPFWAKCVDLGLFLAVHAGYGAEQREFQIKVEELQITMKAEGRTDLLAEIVNNAGHFFDKDLRPRRAMWQMMLGGVFDRHPDLRLLMAEVRGDWMPATLRYLDGVWEEARASLPATRRPSEYWQENCLVSLSFIHKAEVALRDQIGVGTITFGRDFPHVEGTWPNTRAWISDAFAGVPDDELRLMLGENAIRVLGLDRASLAAVAARIGPTIEEITGSAAPEVDPRLVEIWDARSGYLKPAERFDEAEIDDLLEPDLAVVTARG